MTIYEKLDLFMFCYLTISIFSFVLFFITRDLLPIHNTDWKWKYKNKSKLFKEHSISIAKTYAFGFTCGFFILFLTEFTSIEKVSFITKIGLILSVISLFLIILEESISLGKELLNSFLDALDGVLYNFIPANLIFILVHDLQNRINIDKLYSFYIDTKEIPSLYSLKFSVIENHSFFIKEESFFILSFFLMGISCFVLILTHIIRALKLNIKPSNNYVVSLIFFLFFLLITSYLFYEYKIFNII